MSLNLSAPAPCLKWRTSRDMLEEVLTDLRTPQVQNFLLRSPCQFDLQLLTSPDFQSRSISDTLHVCQDRDVYSTQDSFDYYAVSLVIPSHSIDDELVTAIGVESMVFDFGCSSLSDHINHAILNVKKGRRLLVATDEMKNMTQVVYYSRDSSKRVIYAMLYFDRQSFLSTFNPITYGIDVDLLKRAMLYSFAGECEVSSCPPAGTLAPRAGTVMQGEQLPSALRRAFSFGDAYNRCHLCYYTDGEPSGFLNLALCSTRAAGTSVGTANRLRSWAVTSIMEKSVVVVSAPLSSDADSNTNEQGLEQVDDCIDSMLSQTSDQRVESGSVKENHATMTGSAEIPPPYESTGSLDTLVRTPQRKEPKKMSIRGMTYADELDAKREEKLELRKLKNRRSAARSHARKRKRRQEERNQQQSGPS